MGRQHTTPRSANSLDEISQYDFLKWFFVNTYGLQGVKEQLLRLLRAAYGEISLNESNLLSHYLALNKRMVQLMKAILIITRKGQIQVFDKPDLLHHAGNLRLSLYLPPDSKPANAWEWLPKSLSLDEIADPAAVIHAFFSFKSVHDWPITLEELFVSAFSIDSRSAADNLDDLPHFLSLQEHLVKFLEAASLILMRHLNAKTLPSPVKVVPVSVQH